MNKTILIADDSKTIQTAVGMTFRCTAFEIVPVGSGDEAMKKIPDLKPDLVLADIVMPGQDGYALCRAIKNDANMSGIPVVLLGGASTPVDEAKAQAAGADGHIQKPFDSQALIDRALELTGGNNDAKGPVSFAQQLAQRQGAPSTSPTQPKAPAAPSLSSSPGQVEQAFVPPSTAAGGPSLEPPTPSLTPKGSDKVDVWSLTDSQDKGAPAAAKAVTEKAAAQVAAAAGAAVPGLPQDELVKIAKNVIEQIAWEVVPDLAENIIRQELTRLLKE